MSVDGMVYIAWQMEQVTVCCAARGVAGESEEDDEGVVAFGKRGDGYLSTVIPPG